jgi:hypothetical protein
MSTKSTIADGYNFHFYHDLLEDKLYLEITKHCGCTTTTEIPINVYLAIARLNAVIQQRKEKHD